MDLGATVCTPARARPVSCARCAGFACAAERGEPERFPVKPAKAEKPTRRGDAFVIVRDIKGDPHILLRRRSDKGLLGGMMEVPGAEWTDAAQPSGLRGSRA